MAETPKIPEVEDPFGKRIAISIALLAVCISFIGGAGDQRHAVPRGGRPRHPHQRSLRSREPAAVWFAGLAVGVGGAIVGATAFLM
jgi:hypothetical protein